MADKYSYVQRPKPVDILDPMLNYTTSTTQRITHNLILGNIVVCVLALASFFNLTANK